jgi:hypothetical protein
MLASIPARTLNPIRSRRGIPRFSLFGKCSNDRLSRGLKVMAPIPQSLSGCPMLDGEKLFKGKVSVIGVFTECPEAKGTAVGTSSTKVIALLDGM